MKVCVERYNYGSKQVTGKLFVYDNEGNLRLNLHTLELPWKDNKRRVSCIPEGEYEVIKHRSPKFKNSFWIQDVPDRSEILIHAGNYYTQILGCILVGLDSRDINGDGETDVVSSRRAIERMYHHLPDRFILTIQDCRPKPKKRKSTAK